MLERLLVPLDAWPVAEQVLPYVTLLAKRLGQPVVLLSVVADGDELNPVATMYEAEIADLMEKRRAYAQRYLDSIRAQLEREGVWATVEVATGPVAETILAAASEHRAGLIAMATHGRVGPERWFLGSVADRVVHAASVPVLLVRPRDDSPLTEAVVNEILLPLDGSPLAEVALPYATFLAQRCEVPIRLIQTFPLTWLSTVGADAYGYAAPPEVLTALEEDVRQYLERTAEKLRVSGVDASTEFAFRVPDQAITERAAASGGALVVMSSHGRSGLGRTLLGSVTDRVIRSSEAPVLVVREVS